MLSLLGWFVGLTVFAWFCTGGNLALSAAFGALYAVGALMYYDKS